MNEIMVEKAKWSRGARPDDDYLLYNPANGKYDVLGKLLMEVGYTPNQLNKLFPSQVKPSPYELGFSWLVVKASADTDICTDIVRLNDDKELTDDKRVAKINELLKRRSYKIVLTDTTQAITSKAVGRTEAMGNGYMINGAWWEFNRTERLWYCETDPRRLSNSEIDRVYATWRRKWEAQETGW